MLARPPVHLFHVLYFNLTKPMKQPGNVEHRHPARNIPKNKPARFQYHMENKAEDLILNKSTFQL